MFRTHMLLLHDVQAYRRAEIWNNEVAHAAPGVTESRGRWGTEVPRRGGVCPAEAVYVSTRGWH